LKRNQIVLSFDLDNTLIDNREGIVNSFKYALNKHKLPVLNKNELEKTIGIPLYEVFQNICDFDPNKLITAFREFYSKKGIFQGKLLSGIREKLEELKDHGFILGIITSKKQELAVRITKILDIFKYFEYIIGETDDVKSKLDPNLKKQLFQNYPINQFIVIGDHQKDKALAFNLKVPFIGVLTGNTSATELSERSQINDSRIIILNSVSDITPDIIYNLLKK
jgi:phosphoglycolate phosphatase